MNLAATAPTWLLLILAAALAAAAIEDAVRLRISNVTCLAVLIGALIAMGLQGFPMALWQNAVVFLALLVLGTPLFATGKVDAGRVEAIKSNTRYGLLMSMETAKSVATQLSWYAGIFGTPDALGRHYQKVSEVTPANLVTFAKKYLTAANRTQLTLTPKKAGGQN